MIDDSNPAAMRQWRVLVALCLIAFFVHIMAACGLLKFMGVDGFANTKEMATISVRLETAAGQTAEIKSRLLEQSIIAARSQQCTATSKRYFTDHLRELTDEFYATNKRVFEVPACESLN